MQVARGAGLAFLLSAALAASSPASQQSAAAPPPLAPPAQEPAAPVLSPADQQLLSLWESRLEGAALRVSLAQAQMELVRRDAAAAVATLQREGYTLRRGDSGGWSYEKVPAR